MYVLPLGYSSLNYWPEPLKKAAAKRIANDFVASRRSSEFADGLKGMSTLYNISKWVQKGRVGLPEYLLRTCPSSRSRVTVTVTVTVTVFLYY